MSEQQGDPLLLEHQLYNIESHIDFFPSWFDDFKKDHPNESAIIENAKQILDLGSGIGHSSRGLLKVCSQVQEVTTVDRKQTADLSDQGVKHKHYIQDMNEYLEKAPDNSADIVIVFNVPGDFNNEAMYDHLKRVLKKDGLVITFDTTLIDGSGKTPEPVFKIVYDRAYPQRKRMESRFKSISDPTSKLYRVWQNKKD